MLSLPNRIRDAAPVQVQEIIHSLPSEHTVARELSLHYPVQEFVLYKITWEFIFS
jgi:hypothetical protein